MKIADPLEADADRFAVLETLDVGKPIRESRSVDIPLAIDHFRYFAGVTRSQSDEAIMLDEQTLSIALSEAYSQKKNIDVSLNEAPLGLF